MLSGFNTNIRHRGVLFHVQTEDSGVRAPHIITHLYYGGTILASEKSGYAEMLDADDLEAQVKSRMEAQHKAMLKRLRAKDYDENIGKVLGEAIFDPASAEPDATGATTHPEPPAVTAEPTPMPESATPARSFGEGIVSEKPLDEVVLEYLVDSARKRKRSSP
jgi:hypothetical protein